MSADPLPRELAAAPSEPGAESLLALTSPPDGQPDPYRAYLDSLDSNESKMTMAGCLDTVARIVLEGERGEPFPADAPKITGAGRSWWNLRYKDVLQIRAKLTEKMETEAWAPGTVNKHLVAVRRVVRQCQLLGLVSVEDCYQVRQIPGVKASREPTGRSIHQDEISALLTTAALKDGPAGVRDAALIGIVYCTGARREELATARIEHYDAAERSVKIVGKGNKERVTYIHPLVVPYLERWLAELGERRGPLFRPINKAGRISQGALTKRSIGRTVDRIRRLAGLPPLATHDFRRTFIGDLLDEGVDLVTVQELVGHASPVTTARYDRRPGRKRRDAVDKLPFPAASVEGREDLP